MAERLKAHAWKACIRATVSRVRIPLPPPIAPFKGFRLLNDLQVRNEFPHRVPHLRQQLERLLADVPVVEVRATGTAIVSDKATVPVTSPRGARCLQGYGGVEGLAKLAGAVKLTTPASLAGVT